MLKSNYRYTYAYLRYKSRRKIMNWERLKANVIFWVIVGCVLAFVLFIVMGAATPETELHRSFRRLAARTSSLERRVEYLESHLVAYRADTQYGRIRRSRARERHLNRVEQRLRNARFTEYYDWTLDKYKDAPESESIDIRERRYGDD